MSPQIRLFETPEIDVFCKPCGWSRGSIQVLFGFGCLLGPALRYVARCGLIEACGSQNKCSHCHEGLSLPGVSSATEPPVANTVHARQRCNTTATGLDMEALPHDILVCLLHLALRCATFCLRQVAISLAVSLGGVSFVLLAPLSLTELAALPTPRSPAHRHPTGTESALRRPQNQLSQARDDIYGVGGLHECQDVPNHIIYIISCANWGGP